MVKKLRDKKKNKIRDIESLLQKEDKDYPLIERIYEYIKSGMRSNEILTMLSIEDDSLSEKKFTNLLRKAYVLAENNVHKDREYIFQLHMERYEKIYEKSIVMEDFWGNPLDPRKDWQVIRARYVNAVKALKNKEKLLGLHDKSFTVEFNDQKTIVLEKEHGNTGVPGVDIDRLTFEEQKELLSIIKEARTVPIEGIQRVTIKRTVIEIDANGNRSIQTIQTVEDTKDIEFEDMPLNVVDKFKDITPKQPEDEPQSGVIVIDNRPKDIEPKMLEDMQEKINSDLIQAFKKKLKENR